jgi:PAS domain S-box-containing protein
MNKRGPDKRDEWKNYLQSLQAGFWEWVPANDQLTQDEAWYALFGGIAGIRIQRMQEKIELIHRFDRKKVQDSLGRMLSGVVSEFRLEYRMRGQDGKFFEIAEFFHVAERSASGMPTRIIGLTRKKDLHRLQPGMNEPGGSFVVTDIVTTLKIPCLLVNADTGKFELWNDAALALFKLSRARMASANLFSLSAEPIKLKNSFAGNVSLIPLHYIRNGEGLLQPVEIIFTSYPVDECNYFFCILRDLTQQKHIEKKLKESEQSLRNTISSLGDLILVADQNGNITEHFETGCTLSDAYKDILKNGNPFPGKARKVFLKAMDKLIETQEVQQFEVQAKKNGIWWFDIRLSLRKDEFNQVTGTTVVVRDISREKETKNMFSEHGESFGQLAELMPLSMAEFDAQGQILFLNGQALKLFGIPRHSMRGKQVSLREFMSAEDYSKFLSLEGHLVQGSKQRAIEFFVLRPDGTRTPVICQFDVQLQGSQLLGYRAVLIDKSLQHSMEESLIASKDQAEKKFSNRMIRISKLLEEISLRLEEFASQSLSSTTDEKISETVYSEANLWKKRITNLKIFAGDLNRMTGMGADREKLVRGEISSREIMEWIKSGRNRNAGDLKQNGMEDAILVSSGNEFTLITDKVLFFRLLDYMLISIMVSGSGTDNQFRMSFADGQVQFLAGEPMESLEKKNALGGLLSGKMEDADQIEVYGDRALRIRIMQLIAELLGGSLENEGSILCLKLPGQLSVRPGENNNHKQLLAGKRILVVDEDRSLTEQLKSKLAESGVKLWEVQTGRQCLFYCLHQELPDLVLIDPRLPDLSGIEVLNTLRKNEILIPVVAHTAFATSEDRRKFIAAGFTDCLPKPFQTEALIQTLINALAY